MLSHVISIHLSRRRNCLSCCTQCRLLTESPTAGGRLISCIIKTVKGNIKALQLVYLFVLYRLLAQKWKFWIIIVRSSKLVQYRKTSDNRSRRLIETGRFLEIRRLLEHWPQASLLLLGPLFVACGFAQSQKNTYTAPINSVSASAFTIRAELLRVRSYLPAAVASVD